MSCPDQVFCLIDNPEFPHQNVKDTICPGQELIYKRSVTNPILYLFFLLILFNLFSKFDNILYFCQQLIILYSLTLFHAQLTNCMHCFTIGIKSPLSIGLLTCSIKKWVLIKPPPNLLKCSPYFLFNLNERVHQQLHQQLKVNFFWIVYADIIYAHIVLNVKKCISIYGRSLE